MQRFAPSHIKEEILLLHGFMDHSGSLAPFIRALTNQGYSVTAVDFQGHGISGGKRYRIENFHDYHLTLQKALARLAQHHIHPQVIIGHSTGGGVAAHYVLSEPDVDWKKCILVAPLLRSRAWKQTKLGYYAAQAFIEHVSRRYRTNSSDQDFLLQQKKDPLSSSRIPLTWVRAMFEWEERFRKLPAHPMNISILQGTDDRTVAWEHNLRFFKEKFPNAKVSLIEKGKHQLLNEAEPIRSIVYHLIHREMTRS
nr:alpha/beta fold hydrolase [Geomicrobium halophilum]